MIGAGIWASNKMFKGAGMAHRALMGDMGRGVQGAAIGAAAGAGYGALSSNTSVLGGAMMGAMAGRGAVGGGRMVSDYRRARKAGSSALFSSAMSVGNRISNTANYANNLIGRAKIASNNGVNKFNSGMSAVFGGIGGGF